MGRHDQIFQTARKGPSLGSISSPAPGTICKLKERVGESFGPELVT
jgi:hypothetical protein